MCSPNQGTSKYINEIAFWFSLRSLSEVTIVHYGICSPKQVFFFTLVLDLEMYIQYLLKLLSHLSLIESPCYKSTDKPASGTLMM